MVSAMGFALIMMSVLRDDVTDWDAWGQANMAADASSGPSIWLSAGALMILGVGYSRVYFGVHYITDIAAGYLAGLFCISTAFLIIRDKRTASSGYRYISSYRN